MKVKMTLAVASAAVALFASADNVAAKNANTVTGKPAFREMVARMGGFVVDRRAMKGKLVVVNAQTEANAETVEESTVKLEKDAKIRIEHRTGNFDLRSARRIGEATVYVISDESLPATMVAADDRWGFVNVAKLRTERTAFFKSRVHKAVVRVAGLVLGAGDSYIYPMCLTGHICSAGDLDQVPSAQLPHDVMQRIVKSMGNIGIGQYHTATYKKACEEGWAPAPTNEVQKAIWDKVHEMPTEPIRIKYKKSK